MSIIRESAGDRTFNAVNLFFLTIIFLIVLYPLVFVVAASFSDPRYVGTGQVFLWPRGLTAEGYRRVFQDPDIMIGYRNTVFYTLAGTLLNLVVTLPAAYALSRRDLVGKNAIMFLMTFTMYFSGGMIPTFLIVRDLKLYDTWLVLLLISAVSTYNLIIARTFFANGVPKELEEAAQIDGCTQARTFFRIVLPLSKALLGVLALYYGVAHWNSYFSALIYLSDRGKVPLQLVLREILIESQMKEMLDPVVSDEVHAVNLQISLLIRYAAIVVSSVPVMVAYPFLQKYFNKGVMLGSIKG